MKPLKFDEVVTFLKKGLPESREKKVLVNQLISAFSKGGDRTELIGTRAVKLLTEVISRKDLIIEASLNNTGILYLGFDALVTATKHFCTLEAGESWHCDSYLGEVYIISDTAAQRVNYGEW